jgi:hypothetical protein
MTLSLLESLTRLPAAEREAILASLSEDEAEQLQYDWSFYARPNQLLPAGEHCRQLAPGRTEHCR